MRIIITGGAGFIGSHFVDLCLQNKYEVVVLDNFSTGRRQNLAHVLEEIELVECDISRADTWEHLFKGASAVVHLAALADIVPSIQKPNEYFDSNVKGTLNVLEAARSHNVDRVIYSASSSCYGMASQFPTLETAECEPQYPYALTKQMGEDLVLHWHKVYKLHTTSLRFFNVYGPRSRTSGTYGAMFGVFLAQKLAGEPLTVVGDGTQTRDFTYVTDIARALFKALTVETPGQIFNVGSGKPVSVMEVVRLLKCNHVFIPKRPGEPEITHADVTKIYDQLGWTPEISIEQGVEKILSEIDYWKEAVVWKPETIAKATQDWFEYLGK